MSKTRRLRYFSALLTAVVVALIVIATPAWSAQSARQVSNSSASSHDILIAFLAFDREQYDVAARHFLHVAQAHPDVQIAEYAMRSALLADDRERAIAAGQLWSRLDSDNPVSIEFRVRAYSRLAAIEPAVDELDRLRQLSIGDGYHGYLPLLPLLFRDPSNLISIKLMQGLVQRHKHDVYAHFAMSDLATRFRLHELALSSSRWALDIQADFSPAVVQHASSLRMLNRGEEAVDYLFRFLQKFPADEQVRAYYARLLIGLNQLLESYAQYLILSEQNNSNEDYIYALAKIAYKLEDFDAAWRYSLELVVRGERSEEAKFMLGKIEEQNGNIDTAVSWYRAIGPSQFFFDGQVRAAELFVEKGNFPAALAAIRELRESNPVGHLADVILLEGETLVTAGRANEAYKLYTEYLDGPPRQQAELLHARALLSRDMGNQDAFVRDLVEALATDEDHHPSLLDLGVALASNKSYQEATAYLSHALELRPDDAQTLAHYGWLQLRLGQYSSALSYLERADQLDDDPLISAYLGEALWKTGSLDKARVTWHRGLASAPDDVLLNSLIQGYQLP